MRSRTIWWMPKTEMKQLKSKSTRPLFSVSSLQPCPIMPTTTRTDIEP
jgi:hypothetical protein